MGTLLSLFVHTTNYYNSAFTNFSHQRFACHKNSPRIRVNKAACFWLNTVNLYRSRMICTYLESGVSLYVTLRKYALKVTNVYQQFNRTNICI